MKNPLNPWKFLKILDQGSNFNNIFQLQDKDTRDFIYDFIDRHGGIEKALEEVERKTPAPAPPPRQSSIARPPPPSKVQATPPNKAPMDPPHRSHGTVINF